MFCPVGCSCRQRNLLTRHRKEDQCRVPAMAAAILLI